VLCFLLAPHWLRRPSCSASLRTTGRWTLSGSGTCPRKTHSKLQTCSINNGLPEEEARKKPHLPKKEAQKEEELYCIGSLSISCAGVHLREFLVGIRGLGLKSTECIRLLCLRHLAFPVSKC